jgi:uncharacterized protein YbaP (TraB family)
MSLFKRFRRQLAAFGAIASTTCAVVPAAEAKTASPAMWKVADADTTIYLFGTIHLLPKGTAWRSTAFDKAAAGSDTLVVETVIDESNPGKFILELRKLALSDGLPPLAERISPAKLPALEAAVAKLGARMSDFDKVETWAVAFELLGLQFRAIGLDPGSGVETTLKQQFVSGGKSIDQLETNAEQLSYFDGLSEESQRLFLADVLEDPSAMKTQFSGMLAAWSKGDVPSIAKTFNADLGNSPELKKALLDRRNANWARWVKTRLDQPGTVMVAVGAGHLAGSESVLTILEKQGLKVTRVQ